jgi:ComF family protein
MLNTINKAIKPFLQNVIDVVFPPQCLVCRKIVDAAGNLCHLCWEDINFIGAPQCEKCGLPFELDVPDGLECGNCIATLPKYSKARAVFQYGGKTAKLIRSFKYEDNIHASKHFAKWMMRVGAEFIVEADIIAPVPLHKRRLFKRRYNQSALLASAISRESGIKANNALLLRVKNTPPQAGLSSGQRKKNVSGAFKLNPKYENEVIGKNIILVDDVITTGSTINACTQALLNSGAIRVNVLTLAMTVKG